MTTLVLEADPAAKHVHIDTEKLRVDLEDGRSLIIPLAWYPRLLHGTAAERANWQLLGEGYAIEWPALDEHIGIEGLIAGRRSGESEASFQCWLQARELVLRNQNIVICINRSGQYVFCRLSNRLSPAILSQSMGGFQSEGEYGSYEDCNPISTA